MPDRTTTRQCGQNYFWNLLSGVLMRALSGKITTTSNALVPLLLGALLITPAGLSQRLVRKKEKLQA